MDNKLTTSQVDPSLGLAACNAFAAGDYKSAQQLLTEVLDIEPANWLARHYLAVCYLKTNQLFSAQRAFRHIFDKCADEEIKSQACLMLQRVNAQLQGVGTTERPPEFGRFLDQPGMPNANSVKKGWNSWGR